ncbi:MAG: dolichol-phosphate mannosyltransferase [Rhodospirillales bacterium CG15_BIG_FIL_POST_REV_8_21_14_020_66_15]|nr:MAG: dolichol-phosphate mannosyltransferase [Rhodospirillales bacterium CG15_BIG_FIL_POST_REV_8_21_14_020_66_15]
MTGTLKDTALPALAVVVPVHNETENLSPLIGEIRAALGGGVAYEIVYVDDGSTDATLARLADLAKDVPELRVLRHVNCCGQSAAIWTGVQHARAPLIATLDGDGQNDPADIPALVEKYKAEGGGERLMIAGLRAKRRDTAIRRLSSRIANGIRAGLLKDDTPDTGCGLKVFPRQAFLDMPRFDHMHRFMPALMIRLGGRVMSVPVNHRPRERGTSKYGVWNRLWVGIVDLFGVMWLQRRGSKPQVVEETPVRGAVTGSGG